jgi:exopolysaccharide biosynthesis operon protein EpsL
MTIHLIVIGNSCCFLHKIRLESRSTMNKDMTNKDINKKQRAFLVCGLLALCAAPVAPVHAEEGDAFGLTVSEAIYHDSNLYRLPSGVDAPENKRSDTYSVTYLRGGFDKVYGRQGLHAHLAATHMAYHTHDDLDNTGGDAGLGWDWRLGDHWSGALGYNYSETFVPFDDAGGTERLTRRLGRANASINYWFHPDWAVGVGGASVRSDYDDDMREGDEYKANEWDFNITYRPSTGNRLVFTVRGTDGRFPNRPAVEGQLREYDQRDARLSGEWQLTGATRLSGYAGYTQREYKYASNRDYNGMTGNLSLHWTPSAKAIVDLSLRREIGADQDYVSNYAVTESATLAPTWVITDKVRVGASLKHMRRDYRGDPGYGAQLPLRNDRTNTYGLNVQYLPVPAAALEMGVQRTRRSAKKSVYENRDYRAQSVWVSGAYRF